MNSGPGSQLVALPSMAAIAESGYDAALWPATDPDTDERNADNCRAAPTQTGTTPTPTPTPATVAPAAAPSATAPSATTPTSTAPTAASPAP
jgi:hypothetical protein